jgi:Flp pilus assembly pilin Flp
MLGDAGASAVEYALIIAAVAALLVPIAFAITDVLHEVLQNSCESTGEQNGLTPAQIAAQC